MAFSVIAYAQDEPVQDNKSEEIIIRNKGDKKMQVIVQINGDSILVNGIPLADFSDNDICVSKRKMMFRKNGDNMMQFNFQDNGGMLNPFNNDDSFLGNNDDTAAKAFLGVTTEKADKGVQITEVMPGSAAEKAGLKEGDIITKIDNVPMNEPKTLYQFVQSKKPNDEIAVSYINNGKVKKLNLTLGERKKLKPRMYTFRQPMMPMPGMDNGDMNDGQMTRPRPQKLGLKIQDTEDGHVKVISVDDSSAAAKAGLEKDDIITEIDGMKINNTDDARQQLHPEPGKNSYRLKISRNNMEKDIEIFIPKKLKTADL